MKINPVTAALLALSIAAIAAAGFAHGDQTTTIVGVLGACIGALTPKLFDSPAEKKDL